jgi:hypothetical protein
VTWSRRDEYGLEGVVGEHVWLGEGGAVLIDHRDGVAARRERLVPVRTVGADLVEVDDPEPG